MIAPISYFISARHWAACVVDVEKRSSNQRDTRTEPPT